MPAPDPAEYLILSCSLRSTSRSRVMSEHLRDTFAGQGITPAFIDLREFVLPLCDGEAAYSHPHVDPLTELIGKARVIFLATPIYNYDANAAAKNLIELTGSAWEDKTVGFLCAAGGHASYMSVMSLANSLMLDFRCLIIPRFVYAKGEDFTAQGLPNAALEQRIVELAEASVKIRNAV
jgi:FMN reductase